MRTSLNPESLQEGVNAHFERKFPLDDYENQEIDQAIGVSIQEKIAQGFRWGMIVFQIYVPFFLSQIEEVAEMREAFIEENGGTEKIEFYTIKRTGEVIVLMK